MRWMRTAIAAAAAVVILAPSGPPAPAQSLSGSPGKAYPQKLCGRTGTPPTTTSTTEAPMASCRVPAGTLGPDGCLLIIAFWYGVTQNTIPVMRFHTAAGLGGNGFFSSTNTAGNQARDWRMVCNVGSVSVNAAFGGSFNAATQAGAPVALAVNTASDAWVNFNGYAVSGGTLTLQDWTVIALP